MYAIFCSLRILKIRGFILNDARHGKTDLKIFVVSYQKKDGYDTDFSEFDCAEIIDYILEKSVSDQKKDGNDKVLKVCFLMTHVKWASVVS